MLVMLDNTMNEKAAVPIANILVLALGIFSFSIILIEQFVAALIPLIFAPMVCFILCSILYKSQSSMTNEITQLS